MNKKLLLFLMSLILVSMFASAVRAVDPEGTNLINIIKDSATLRYLAVDFIAGLKQTPPDPGAVTVARVLFIIMIIIVINSLLSITPQIKEWNKNARVGLAIIISLIAGIAIPKEYLVKVIAGAGYILILIPMALFVVLCYYGIFKWFPGTDRTDYVWKALFAGFAGYLLATIATLLDGVGKGAEYFGFVGFVSSILKIAVFVNWFYFAYAVYSVITGPAGATGAGAKLSEKVPWIGRGLRRLGRSAYRAERLADREVDELEKDVNGLTAVDLDTVDIALAGADAMKDVRNHLQSVRRRLNKETNDRIKKRTGNSAIDMYTWARKIGDKKLIQEAEGIEELVKEMGKELDEGEKNFDKLMKTVERHADANAGAGEGFDNSAEKAQTKKQLGDAIRAYDKAIDLLKNQIKALENDIIKKAGEKDIELSP